MMNDEILALKKEMLEGMVDYMNYVDQEGNDPCEFDDYSQTDVDCCETIIDTFLQSLEKTPSVHSNEFIMEAVKTAVLALNALNEQCNDVLIETGQREQLCKLMRLAAKKAGLVTNEQDITGEWRDW